MSSTAGAPRPWARSLPTVATVRRLVTDQYDIPVSRAELVRSFNNDVYRVDAADRSYALKVYGVDRFAADEVRWEQALARHLVTCGVTVAADVGLRNGDTVGVLEAPEGDRPFGLTEWVPGKKPQPPWSDRLYRDLGSALARFHEVADRLHSDYPRRPVRTGQETAEVVAALDDDHDRRDLVQRTALAAQRQLSRLCEQGLFWGIRHGDPSLDNIHVSGHSIHLYDLDLAGPGWQIEDLTGALSTAHADVFLSGYTAVKALPTVEMDALPWLRILGTIENLRFHLVGKPAFQGSSTLAEGWVDSGFASLAEHAHQLGL